MSNQAQTRRPCRHDTRQHNGKTYVTHLLRRTFREDGKVKHVTVGNPSDLPDDLIESDPQATGRRSAAARDDRLPDPPQLASRSRGRRAGHAKKIGLDRLISSKPCREAELVVAMIALRIIAPGSKLANLTSLQPETAEHSLAVNCSWRMSRRRIVRSAWTGS